MDPSASLSLDQLAHILSHVNTKHRLAACSLVSSTWRAAAAQATTSITAHYTATFGPWLRLHSAEVRFSSLHIANSGSSDSIFQLALPLAQLRGLQALTLSQIPWRPGPEAASAAAQPQADESAPHSSSFSTQGLEQLTALTQLMLINWSVKLAGLSALTGLRELTCQGDDGRDRATLPVEILDQLQPDTSQVEDLEPGALPRWWTQLPDCIPAFSAAERELAAAFPRLQRLTSLTLTDGISSSALVLSHLSSLQALKELVLARAASDSPAFAGCKLPQSLTRLKWTSWQARHAQPDVTHSLTPHNTAWLSQLTALQRLNLECVGTLDMSLLASMRNLRILKLWDVGLTCGGPGLQTLSCFTALTELMVDGEREGPVRGRHAAGIPATEAAALTSSSQLASLTLSGHPGRLAAPHDYKSLFPPSRHLPHLTALYVSADFLRDEAAVRQATSCCPNLLDVMFDKSYSDSIVWGSPAEEARVVAGLAAMRSWTGLRELMLGGSNSWPNLPGAQFWQAHGALTQLTDLQLRVPQQPSADDLAPLTGCRGLGLLIVEYDIPNSMLNQLKVVSTAGSGQPPNVWQLLSEVLSRLALSAEFSQTLTITGAQ